MLSYVNSIGYGLLYATLSAGGYKKYRRGKVMKQYGYIAAVLIIGFSMSGCMNRQGEVDYTKSGILAGAATGSVLGGSVSHSPEGAIVGAAIGAMTGGVIGKGVDQEKEQQQNEQVTQSAPLLSLTDLKNLVDAGIGDDVIISQIHASGAVYYLKTEDIIELKKSGVSEKIIDYLINTPYTVADSVSSDQTVTPVYQDNPVVVAPYPHYIWIDGSWMWSDRHWQRPLLGGHFPGPGGPMR